MIANVVSSQICLRTAIMSFFNWALERLIENLRFLSHTVMWFPVTWKMFPYSLSFLPWVNDEEHILPKKFSFAEPDGALFCAQIKILWAVGIRWTAIIESSSSKLCCIEYLINMHHLSVFS